MLLLVVLLAVVLGVGAWWVTAGRLTSAPALIGMSRTSAESAAGTAGVVLAFRTEYSETVPVGDVVRTDPSAGSKVAPGSTMQVYLSQGPERVEVPDLSNKTVPEAEQALAAARLQKGTVSYVFSDEIAEGRIVGFSPDAGIKIKVQSGIDYIVSKGPEPVTVPDVTGKPIADARRLLNAAGLKVTTTEQNDKTVPAGSVISSSPANGASAHRGDTISLVVSKGPVLVTVPAVRGKSQDDAKQALEAAGFKVTVKNGALLPLGIASYTDPPAGKPVAEGSTITLVIV